MVVRRRSCGVDVSGSHQVCRVAMYTVKSGCSGPNAYRYLTPYGPAFASIYPDQAIVVLYIAGEIYTLLLEHW